MEFYHERIENGEKGVFLGVRTKHAALFGEIHMREALNILFTIVGALLLARRWQNRQKMK